MPSRAELQQALRNILDDVVEQAFTHLIHHPQNSDELNRIIREASDEFNYLYIKIDAHQHKSNSDDLQDHYHAISKDVQKKSLHLLSRLQRIQSNNSVNARGEKPSDLSSWLE
jgi:hypothetical protein